MVPTYSLFDHCSIHINYLSSPGCVEKQWPGSTLSHSRALSFWGPLSLTRHLAGYREGISGSRELVWMENIICELSVTHLICYLVQHSHKIWIYNVISLKHSNVVLPKVHVTKISVMQKCYYSLYRPQGQEDLSVDGVSDALCHVYCFFFVISLSLRIPSEVNRVLLYSIVSLFLNPHTRGHHILYWEGVTLKKRSNWANTIFLCAGSRPDRLPSQLPIPLPYFMTCCLVAGVTLISYRRALFSMTLEYSCKKNKCSISVNDCHKEISSHNPQSKIRVYSFCITSCTGISRQPTKKIIFWDIF
jgi:hypothetical protein